MSSPFRLDQKVAIITGGVKGIGAAISEVYAKQGARTYILDIDQETGELFASQLKEKGYSIEFRLCNVADYEEVKQAVNSIYTQEKRIDILVNNAGIAHIGDAVTTTPEELDRVYQINVKGVYNCLNHVIPYMIKGGGGAIINMSSVAAEVAVPQRFAYSMTKGAVSVMTYSVAKDFVNQGIRCNAIAPARVHTPFVDGYVKKHYPGKEEEMYKKLSATQPIGRMAEPKEVANLALYLASEEGSFCTGTIYPIDGGFIRLNV